jgi:D-alanyl-D-alanine carboxypeptidase
MLNLVLVSLSLAFTQGDAEDAGLPARLAHVVEAAAAERNLPGASIALVDADAAVLSATAGYAERDGGSITPETRFLAGSIGKTFAALVTAQLALEGELDLDAPISSWLADRPWFERLRNGDRITLRQLLNHSAGVPDYLESPRFYIARFGRGERGFTPDEIIRYVANASPTGEPGEHYAYSDTHYILVGLILETVTGARYADLVRERVIEPLDLTSTQVLEGRTFENLAVGHDPGPFGSLTPMSRNGRLKLNYDFEWAAGGLVSTPTDLARFYWALGGDELAAERAVMLANANPINLERQIYYGLGVFVTRYPGDQYRLFHGGGFAGYRSAVVFDTRTGHAIALQGNSKHFEAPDVLLELNADMVAAEE